MIKKLLTTSSILLFFLFVVTPAFAHVVVKPNEAGIGLFQTFSIQVPNEKDIPTVAIKIVIPEDLEYVMPNVKPGWTIESIKTGDDENAKVTEITWTNGIIPQGQRDEFLFQAKVPAQQTTINWKAYQTYADGTIVSWDQNPNDMKKMTHDQMEKMEEEGKGPLSQTKIIDDLSNKSTETSVPTQSNNQMNVFTLLGVIGFALSVFLLIKQSQKK